MNCVPFTLLRSTSKDEGKNNSYLAGGAGESYRPSLRSYDCVADSQRARFGGFHLILDDRAPFVERGRH